MCICDILLFNINEHKKPFVSKPIEVLPYENEPWFYYNKSVPCMGFGGLYHLYNHSFTTNTMVKLW